MNADQKIIGPRINAKNANQIKDGSHVFSRLGLRFLNSSIYQITQWFDSCSFAKFAAKLFDLRPSA